MPGSKHQVHGAAQKEFVNGVINYFVSGVCSYRSDGTVAFTPHRSINLKDIWPINRETSEVLGQGWNDEAGMAFTAVKAIIHVYPNGTIALGLLDKEPPHPHKPHRRAVRKRVVVTDHGIIRESPTDATMRIRISKDNLAASGESIRDLLDREVFKLLSQLPS